MYKVWVWSLASNIMKEKKYGHALSSVVRVGSQSLVGVMDPIPTGIFAACFKNDIRQ